MSEGDTHITKAQIYQHLTDSVDYLCFSKQGGGASDVHITLIELSKTSFGRAVSSPHWLDLVALEEAGELMAVLRGPPPHRYGEIVTQAQFCEVGDGYLVLRQDPAQPLATVQDTVQQLIALITILTEEG